MARGRAVHGPDGRGMPPEAPADRCRADRAALRAGQARITPMAPARRPARRAGSIWRVSESFPELAQAVLEHAQPDRIDIVRAKGEAFIVLIPGLAEDGHSLLVRGDRLPIPPRPRRVMPRFFSAMPSPWRSPVSR
jgi:hypothetical protein